ncbi:DUF368 domain-containing protein [Gulosibacter chungangensis]|uniref:DUF368 domain-containing protein n=1 Tax=Gulosibacter chungangensis TaxID=979746 RepID=A0A7J5BFR1_9MICO|nr:DUF368 domain-containing protein [Gulosibacter chungangensis]KAB1644223.1 DUF368 domain-containing protein [Gulosibacter chungangensis]
MAPLPLKVLRTLIDFIRGALIGIVEIIPGVSGGTVALIIGVYERIIDSAGEFVRGIVHLVLDPPRGRGLATVKHHFRQVAWPLLVPLAIGMILGLLTAAAIVAPIVENHPVQSRAFFAGLILIALWVPARMVGGRWTWREWALAIPSAALAFWFTGLPTGNMSDPSLFLVAVAGAFAVCALAIPGMSGSFILLVMGLYEPTLAAVNDRDFGYLGVLLAGMAVGFALFVRTLQWLLKHHRRVSLAIMTGLMAGSLRALWPWQSESGLAQPPGSDAWLTLLWFVIGALVVTATLVVESWLVRRRIANGVAVIPS